MSEGEREQERMVREREKEIGGVRIRTTRDIQTYIEGEHKKEELGKKRDERRFRERERETERERERLC